MDGGRSRGEAIARLIGAVDGQNFTFPQIQGVKRGQGHSFSIINARYVHLV